MLSWDQQIEEGGLVVQSMARAWSGEAVMVERREREERVKVAIGVCMMLAISYWMRLVRS